MQIRQQFSRKVPNSSFPILLALILLAITQVACGDREEDANQPADSTQTGQAMDSSQEKPSLETGPDNLQPEIAQALRLHPVRVHLDDPDHSIPSNDFRLNVPEGYTITVAAQGYHRPRFMTLSPDNRLFVTDMIDLSDNRKGEIYALSQFDEATGTFAKSTLYLDGLRNPNNVAFHTDNGGKSWIYIPMTDRLVRYPYTPGDLKPSGPPETLTTFPDYGNSYREGGWHLTRTVAFGENGKMYVSVGSSCNVCIEKEEVRASILEMNPDGSEQKIFADGLRNSVGIRSIAGALWGTNMGADHLGVNKPEDNFYRYSSGTNYGWPFAYEYQGKIYPDPSYGRMKEAPPIDQVGLSWAGFPAHSAPLGFDWFGPSSAPEFRNTFVAALHGSGTVAIAHGYSIVRLTRGKLLGDVVNGFLVNGERYGRPCDILQFGEGFLFTDDYTGTIFYVHKGKDEATVQESDAEEGKDTIAGEEG